MDIKKELKNTIQRKFQNNASTFFLNRVLNVIDEASNDREGLLAAVDRVSKTVALFIDKSLAKEISKVLENKIKEKPLSNNYLSNTYSSNTRFSNTHPAN